MAALIAKLSGKNAMRNILALLFILCAMAWFAFSGFTEIPEKNHLRVDGITDLFKITIVPAVLYFFFGSSQGSADKADTIKDQVKK